MKVVTIPGGMLPTNCYLLTDEVTGQTAVIDPGFESEALTDAVKKAGTGKVTAILLTHGHFDHILGVDKIKSLTNAQVYIDAEDTACTQDDSLNLAGMFGPFSVTPFTADHLLRDGDTIELGSLTIRVMHTPGHTAGCCCYIVENAIFTGDTIMHGSVGRTDFPTGSYAQLMDSLKKINDLSGDYIVYPGHEAQSTLEYERENNPYLRSRADDFDY